MSELQFNSVDEAIARREELLKILEEYNNEIFSESEKSKTKEFNDEYQALSEEYDQIEEFLSKKHYHEVDEQKASQFLNKTSLWIWFFFFVLIVLCIYPIYKFIDVSIIIKILSIEKFNTMTTLQQKTLIICAFAIYPVALFIIGLIPRLILIKKQEDKKAYFWCYIVFTVMNLIPTLVLLFSLIIPSLKEL